MEDEGPEFSVGSFKEKVLSDIQPGSPLKPSPTTTFLISSILLAGGSNRSSGCVHLTIATMSLALPLECTSRTLAPTFFGRSPDIIALVFQLREII